MNYNNLNYAAFAARTLLIIIIFSFFNTSNADCKDIATFLRVMGQVLHLKENKPPGTPAKIQEGAAEGDGVHTKVASRAQLRLIDISDLFIAPKSEIVLDYFSINPKGKETIATLVTKGLVHVFGNLLLKHDPPQFFIKTTSAMGSIRGTDFYVLIGKNYPKKIGQRNTLI